MHGISDGIPLQRFIGKRCNQIAIAKFDFEGGWMLVDASGSRIVRSQKHTQREAYRIQKLLDSPVGRDAIEAPTSFALAFENGCVLTVFGDDEQHESFSIQPGNIYV